MHFGVVDDLRRPQRRGGKMDEVQLREQVRSQVKPGNEGDIGDSSIPLWSWNSRRFTQNDSAFLDGTCSLQSPSHNASASYVRLK